MGTESLRVAASGGWGTAGMQAGARVGAILEAHGDTIRVFGVGVLEGSYVYGDDGDDTPVGFVADMVRELPVSERPPNPRIRLDSGKVVWGCECWWMDEDRYRAMVAGYERVEQVDIDELRADYRRKQKEGDDAE